MIDTCEFRIRPLALSYQKQVKHIAAASAYQARCRLRAGSRVFDFTDRSSDLVYKRILLPATAPDEFSNRQQLCDALQIAPTYSDGLMARWLVANFPGSISEAEMIDVAQGYCEKTFIAEGMCVDLAIHDPAKRRSNTPAHLHLILSAHEVGKLGMGSYQPRWQNITEHEKWKRLWAEAF